MADRVLGNANPMYGVAYTEVAMAKLSEKSCNDKSNRKKTKQQKRNTFQCK